MDSTAERTAESFDSFLREKEEQISKMKFLHLEVPHSTQSAYSDSPLMDFSERLGEFAARAPENGPSRVVGFFYKHKLAIGVVCVLIVTAGVIGLSPL